MFKAAVSLIYVVSQVRFWPLSALPEGKLCVDNHHITDALMSIIANDPTTRLAFSMHENKGVYAVLIGSGLSKTAGIPTGWEITLELIRKAALSSGAEEQIDWEAWYLKETGKQPSYSALLEEVASTQSERRAIIQGFLEPTDDERERGVKLPTPAHRAIAEMIRSKHVRVIITTNFDQLMENALRDVGITPTVVSSHDQLLGAEPLTHSHCYILKIHGDYKDARILNTDVELDAYPPEFNAILDRIIDEFGLVIAGWSGEWDNALREAFMRAPSRRYPTFWISRGALGPRAQELVDHRKAVVAKVSGADEFFEALNLKLQTLAENHQSDPASLDLMIAMAKRFMSKPEYNIRLDDLLTAEHRRLMVSLTPIFSDKGKLGKDAAKWKETYEHVTSPLAHLVAAIGRWGDDAAHAMVLSTIRDLVATAVKSPQGMFNVGWLRMRLYPAFLVFTAYATALARAARLNALRNLFESTVPIDERRISTLGEYFNPAYFESIMTTESWNEKGATKRRNPLSWRLAEQIVPSWAPSFSGMSNPQLLFARYEFYSSLFYHSRVTSEEALKLSVASPSTKLNLGGLKWDQDSKRTIEQDMEVPESIGSIVDAGLVPSEQYLELFMQGMKKINIWD